LSIDIIAVILPISLAISAAFVYQRFCESNQLVALQGAGCSPRRMLIPLIHMIILAIGYLYISHAYISPQAWKEFRSLEFQIRNTIEPPPKAGTIFSHNGFLVYAQKYLGNLSFANIFLIDARNPGKMCHHFAREGMVKNNVLVLTDGERVEVDFVGRQNSVMTFQSYNYNLREILKEEQKSAQPNEKRIEELLLDNPGEEEKKKENLALFHQKITSPPLAGIFALWAFLLIFLAPYRRKPSSWRMIILMSGVTTFQGCYFWIANAAAKNLEYVKLNYLLVMISLIILVAQIAKKRIL
jgi:lipopolysaccharide export system permease protein